VVKVNVTGLKSAGTAQCASWAGDGSHRIPMMERANQTPAFDSVRINVVGGGGNGGGNNGGGNNNGQQQGQQQQGQQQQGQQQQGQQQQGQPPNGQQPNQNNGQNQNNKK
jgi:hypothetical protein